MEDIIDVDKFIADPYLYFNYTESRAMRIPRGELRKLQLAGLKRRFAQFRESIPMVKRMADSQGVNAIEDIDDVVPLLFDHEMYKSYPAYLLEEYRFDQLTKWLNKLTSIDLSGFDASGCKSIDEWLIKLVKETPLSTVHTTGTSGTMSFLPWSKREVDKYITHHIMRGLPDLAREKLPQGRPLGIDCVYPYYRSGGWSHAASNDAFVRLIAGSEERFHAAYPGRLSSDLLLLAARRRAAEAKGELDKLHVSPELAARRDEFEAQQRDMPRYLEGFFETACRKLAGKRIFVQCTASMLIGVAQKGLAMGNRKVFAPDSVIVTGGGGKGMVLPDDWEDTVKEFFGAEQLAMSYGMSEMIGVFPRCDQGHYHAPPWHVLFLFDIESGKLLPRQGRTLGRMGYYDLLTETRWGGFVTGDAVAIEWDAPCPCGSTTPYVVGGIKRVSELKKGEAGEEKITCASTPEAYEDAVDFLNSNNT